MTPPHSPADIPPEQPPAVEAEHAPVVYGVTPPLDEARRTVIFWRARPEFRALVILDGGDIRDLTDQLGELVWIGLPRIGEETGVADGWPEDLVEVAKVVLEAAEDLELLLCNVLTRNIVVLEPHQVQRAVAAAVHHLLLAGIEDERQNPPTP